MKKKLVLVCLVFICLVCSTLLVKIQAVETNEVKWEGSVIKNNIGKGSQKGYHEQELANRTLTTLKKFDIIKDYLQDCNINNTNFAREHLDNVYNFLNDIVVDGYISLDSVISSVNVSNPSLTDLLVVDLFLNKYEAVVNEDDDISNVAVTKSQFEVLLAQKLDELRSSGVSDAEIANKENLYKEAFRTMYHVHQQLGWMQNYLLYYLKNDSYQSDAYSTLSDDEEWLKTHIKDDYVIKLIAEHNEVLLKYAKPYDEIPNESMIATNSEYYPSFIYFYATEDDVTTSKIFDDAIANSYDSWRDEYTGAVIVGDPDYGGEEWYQSGDSYTGPIGSNKAYFDSPVNNNFRIFLSRQDVNTLDIDGTNITGVKESYINESDMLNAIIKEQIDIASILKKYNENGGTYDIEDVYDKLDEFCIASTAELQEQGVVQVTIGSGNKKDKIVFATGVSGNDTYNIVLSNKNNSQKNLEIFSTFFDEVDEDDRGTVLIKGNYSGTTFTIDKNSNQYYAITRSVSVENYNKTYKYSLKPLEINTFEVYNDEYEDQLWYTLTDEGKNTTLVNSYYNGLDACNGNSTCIDNLTKYVYGYQFTSNTELTVKKIVFKASMASPLSILVKPSNLNAFESLSNKIDKTDTLYFELKERMDADMPGKTQALNDLLSDLYSLGEEYKTVTISSLQSKYNTIFTKINSSQEEILSKYKVCPDELDPSDTCTDGWWKCAFQFMEKGQASGSEQTLGGLNALEDMVFYIGNIIFIVVTAFLGVKYIWGGADTKFSVKNSLVTLVVAAMVFYGWDAISNALDVEGLLTGSTSASGYENFALTIYNTIMYVVNVAAVGGIIFIGIKYMMAGADGKAEMKMKFIPVVMGIIMVYGTLNLIGFILKITVGSL